MKGKNKDNNKHKENKVENFEVLLRLYCFQEEIKEKMINSEKIKVGQTGILLNKDFIEEYKKYLDYKSFFKKITENQQILHCIKDENGIINSDKLYENNNLLNIINDFKKNNHQLIDKINNIDIKSKKFKSVPPQIKYKEIDKKKLYFIEDCELINAKLFDIILKQLSLEPFSYVCKYIIGNQYLYFNIILMNFANKQLISQIVTF